MQKGREIGWERTEQKSRGTVWVCHGDVGDVAEARAPLGRGRTRRGSRYELIVRDWAIGTMFTHGPQERS